MNMERLEIEGKVKREYTKVDFSFELYVTTVVIRIVLFSEEDIVHIEDKIPIDLKYSSY